MRLKPAQVSLHWRFWADVCRRNGWRMEAGRLLCNEAALGLYASKVWEMAARMAEYAHAGPNLDDLRHALYLLACGEVSLARIGSGADFSKVKNWLLLCADDSNLDAASGLANGDTRNRMAGLIRSLGFSQAYIDAVCRDKFGRRYVAPYWEDLRQEDLRQLLITLRSRHRAHQQTAPAENEPF